MTPAGQRLLPLARRMLTLEQELRDAAAPRERSQWKLSVGISDSLYYCYVEAFLPEFLYRYPDISVTMRSRSSSDMLNMLRDDEIDICVSFLPGTDPGMEAIRSLRRRSCWQRPSTTVTTWTGSRPTSCANKSYIIRSAST